MPEQDSDRVEQFFRKATSKPDVAYNEEDWKKLEARLDATDLVATPVPRSNRTVVIATTLSAILLILVAILVTSYYEFSLVRKTGSGDARPAQEETSATRPGVSRMDETPMADERAGRPGNAVPEGSGGSLLLPAEKGGREGTRTPADRNAQAREGLSGESSQQQQRQRAPGNSSVNGVAARTPDETEDPMRTTSLPYITAITAISREQITRDWMQGASRESRHKQKAMVILPGAEEGETGVAESVTAREETSGQHAATPRLSLLLSFAPDFSSTSLDRYSAPGSAFGGMIHYHFRPRWSIAAGVIKNQKQYTGRGEDYTPPSGYWRYYTNGKIPSTIDGECSVLEFPVMVQYMLHQTNRHRFLAGLGSSSYLMLDESYRYYFDEPNPGAREGWASKDRSEFMFNMVNITVAYERQIVPGLMIGVEPYLKIPVEEIGWTKLKLFSTGASISMRYVILRKKHPHPAQARGPD